jgi:hypothetical protein
MAQQGGYRKPENPAPASGPGALSRRTDGGPAQGAKYMSGMPYGENTMDQQTAAPMAGRAEVPSTPRVAPMPTSLMAPTTRPEEPITSGVDIGDGPGSEAMGQLPNKSYSIADTIKALIPFDPSGDAELIYRKLIDEGY